MQKSLRKTIPAFILLIACLILITSCGNESVIRSVETFDILNQEMRTLDQDSLVIFDVDKVLIIDADPWERGYKKERGCAETIVSLYHPDSGLGKTLDRPTKDRLWSIYLQAAPQILIDKNIPALIQELQSKGVKVIALTRFPVGKLGQISSLEDWRINELAAHHIDFSPAFPEHERIVFDQFSYEDKHPIFKKGILFTTIFACSKGQALQALFDHIGWKPKKVLMFDDKRDNLKSVQEILKAMNITFKGFEFAGASKEAAFFDKSMAEFQMQYLIDHEQWISAAEAQKISGHQKQTTAPHELQPQSP